MHTLLTQITQCTVTYSTVSNYPHTLYTHVYKVMIYEFKCKHSCMTHTCTTNLCRTNTHRLHGHVFSPTCAVWGSREDDLYLAAALELPNQILAQCSRRNGAASSESIWKKLLRCWVVTGACVPNLMKLQTSCCTLVTRILQHHSCWFDLFTQCKDIYFAVWNLILMYA